MLGRATRGVAAPVYKHGRGLMVSRREGCDGAARSAGKAGWAGGSDGGGSPSAGLPLALMVGWSGGLAGKPASFG